MDWVTQLGSHRCGVHLLWSCMGALGPYSYIHIKYIRSKGRAKGQDQMGRVPQMWGLLAVELYGSSRALYRASGAIPISWLRSSSGEPGFGMECGQESQVWGPRRKQQPSAGHLSDMHLGFNVLHPKRRLERAFGHSKDSFCHPL